MSWFLFALIGPFLYALTNHIDKHLLDKHFKQGGVGTLVLFSSLLSGAALPFIFWADPQALTVSSKHVFMLAMVGILNVAVLWCYLLALRKEEASVAIVFYQLVPVFGLILGYFLLSETISHFQFIAMTIIILGATIISFEIDVENNFKLRRETVTLMLAASFFWALGSVLFKYIALEENVWRSLFWEHLTLVLVGVFLFACIPSYRRHFLTALRTNSAPILSLNFLNEGLYILGNIVFSFAYLLGPISLILLVDSFQPIFVLAIGIFLTLFFPNFTREKIHLKHLVQKALAMSIVIFGTYLLFLSGGI
ncbi:DMT family transporter [Candidatus Parcubacteria bacterium]|nr:MAG: DMT family transporter [Candidatus Parcubacteria bacterium]